jgi:hypothetical protein
MRATFSFLFFLAAIQTCAASPVDTLRNRLDGKWEWVGTSGGYAGEHFTPQSEHYSLTLIFSKNLPQPKSDSIGYQAYRNDTLIRSGITSLSSSIAPIQAFGPGNHIMGALEYATDTLTLTMGISDGYSSVFIRSKTSGCILRGTISDSATGAPIGNAKVVLMQMVGEIDLMLDSSRTQTTGGYAFSNRCGSDLYLYTLSDHYYFQSTSIGQIGIDDTITKDIKLKKISTMVSATPDSRPLQGISFRRSKSGLYLSGIKTDPIVSVYNLNGRLFFKAKVSAGATEVKIPELIAAGGSYVVSISVNGQKIQGKIISR